MILDSAIFHNREKTWTVLNEQTPTVPLFLGIYGLLVVLRNESAIDDTEDEPGRRTITIDDDATPQQKDSFQPRLRHAASAGFARAATFERILSNTFRRRPRDSSPSSRRSSMTLPYFTFQRTIGRNSLFVRLTEEQREELGGVEYRAVKLLLKVLFGSPVSVVQGD